VYQGRCYSVARDGHPLRIREEPPVVVGVSLEHGPGRSHQFVRERDDDDVGMSPRLEIREPPSQPVRLLPMMTADGARPMNEEAPEVGIPALADAPKDGLASRGMLPRHQPEPGSEISPLRKCRSIADGSHEGCGRERTDAGYRHEPIAGLVVTRETEDVLIDVLK
jgi:hypothetical protein